MEHDVFISYSSIDKDAANAVCSILEDNQINCWMAPRNITPGVPFAEAIIDGIKSSKVLVLIYSSSSNNSTQVIREVDRAVHIGLPVINLRLEDVPLSKQLEYYISNVHWLDAMTSPLDQHIIQLSTVVKMLLAEDDVRDDEIDEAIRKEISRLAKTTKPLTEKGRYKPSWKKIALPVAAIILILIAILLVIKPLIKQKLSSGSSAKSKSIAVLPFENLSNDPEQDYFSVMLVEEILDRLCKIGGLTVISRTSSDRFKDSDLSLQEIAGQLGALTIVEGSILKIDNTLRIAIQLIDAETDTHLWSRIFEQDYSADIFSIYSDVAQAVASEMNAVITPEEKQLIEKIPTTDISAYDAYLKGRYHVGRFNPGDLDIAMQYFELAKERDPDFALAYAGISSIWQVRQQFGLATVSEASPRSEAAIMKALELDSTLSDVHLQLANRKVWTDWDWEGGEESFRRAIEINPNDAMPHRTYSHLLNILGRPDEAMDQIEIALELDPLNASVWSWYAIDLIFIRRFDEAVKAFQEALKLNPQDGLALGNLPEAMILAGSSKEEVLEAMRHAFNPELMEIMEKYYPEGGYPLGMKKIADYIVERPDMFPVRPVVLFNFYAQGKDIDNAMYWMEKTYEAHDPNLPYLLMPRYDILRDDPRFQEIAGKMHLPYKQKQELQQ